MKNPVLVTGATSPVGKYLVKFLVGRGTRVKAMVYDMRKAEGLEDAGVEIFVGDLRDEEDVRLAMKEVDKVYLITPLVKDMADITRTVVKIAESEGVRKIIRQSLIDCGVDLLYEFWKKHRECDEIVRRSMMDHTFVRLNQLMQGFLKFNGRGIKEEGVIAKPCGEGRTSFVDAYDVAEAASLIIDGNWHEGKTYTLTGPEALSNKEVAERMSHVLGKPVRYEDIDEAKARTFLIDEGYGSWFADGFMEMYEVERRGLASTVTSDIERLIGRRPRRIESFIKENVEILR